MNTAETVTLKNGTTITICNYLWVDPEGREERCRAHASCPICGQCSRIDGEHENGHCTGHLGLNQHIWVPGMEKPKVQETVSRPVRKQPKQFKRPPRPKKKVLKVKQG